MRPFGPVTLAAFALVIAAGWAMAQGSRSALEADRLYQEDRAACRALEGEARRTCLREAAAARQEARRNGLTDERAAYDKNLVARCAYLRGEDRSDCERRMRGEGTTSGSVAGGGIYRELRSTVPANEEETARGGSKPR